MSIEKVRAYFKRFGIEDRIREFEVSSATVSWRRWPWAWRAHGLPRA